MIEAIIQGIFNLINLMFSTVMSPIISAVTVLFPSVSPLFTHINNFLNYSFTYLSLCIDLLMIPRNALIVLFDYFAITYSIYLIIIAVKFIVNIYNKFKI